MTQDEINRAIAERCGWENCVSGFGTETRYRGTPSEVRVTVPYPNYSGDLNAMHEAEKALDDYEHDRMRNQLWLLMIKKTDRDKTSRRVHSAEAHERAEAFVRTIGKWRDA